VDPAAVVDSEQEPAEQQDQIQVDKASTAALDSASNLQAAVVEQEKLETPTEAQQAAMELIHIQHGRAQHQQEQADSMQAADQAQAERLVAQAVMAAVVKMVDPEIQLEMQELQTPVVAAAVVATLTIMEQPPAAMAAQELLSFDIKQSNKGEI
jgi:hypothetical protein